MGTVVCHPIKHRTQGQECVNATPMVDSSYIKYMSRDESCTRTLKIHPEPAPFIASMGTKMYKKIGYAADMGIAFENEHGYGYEFLKPVPDLLIKGDQNTEKSKNKYLAWNSKCIVFIYEEMKN